MASTDILNALPAGQYILTASGEFAVVDEQHKLNVDAAMSKVFAEHNRALLMAYLKDSQADDRRVAILYQSHESHPWGRLTMSLEDFLVRTLYPAGGRYEGLKSFQQKNRHKSLYRGMELMLDYHAESAPTVPVYCPVLFDRHATLGQRPSALGRVAREGEHDIPVFDILNLLAGLPQSRRELPAVAALVQKLGQGILRKDARHETSFVLSNTDMRSGTGAGNVDAYADLDRDRRLQRGLTLPQVDEQHLHETDCIASIERWLKIPHKPVDPAQLRGFAQFRDLDDAMLASLAPRCLVYIAPPGTCLLERGMSDAWNLYLMEGSLKLVPEDGATLRVDGGSEKAVYPVAFLKPRKYTVEALTSVSFLWVHDLLLEAVRVATPVDAKVPVSKLSGIKAPGFG